MLSGLIVTILGGCCPWYYLMRDSSELSAIDRVHTLFRSRDCIDYSRSHCISFVVPALDIPLWQRQILYPRKACLNLSLTEAY